jgi:hypothetical protein
MQKTGTQSAARSAAVAAAFAFGATATLAGCGSSAPTATVTQSEWKFDLSATTAKAGKITLKSTNLGGFEHEIVVVKASDPTALPKKADGSVDEDKIAEEQKFGEIEHVAANTSKTGKFDLKAGKYVVFCNLVEKDGTSHFVKGMAATFTVT